MFRIFWLRYASRTPNPYFESPTFPDPENLPTTVFTNNADTEWQNFLEARFENITQITVVNQLQIGWLL